jgi:hypothetical protein
MPKIWKWSFMPTIPVPSWAAIHDTIGERKMFRTLEPLQQNSEGDETGFFEIGKLPATHENATAVTSELPDGSHMPVIDLDLTCMLVPSTQEGHFHLYINKPMEWEKFVAILEALEAAGVVGPGYLRYTKKRGYATVRYPGVTKKSEPERIEAGMTDAEREARETELDRLVRDLGFRWDNQF